MILLLVYKNVVIHDHGAIMAKSIFISGASSGIGKALSLELVKHGYNVYAGVRNEQDAEALHAQASENLIPLMLDVTVPESILAACGQVQERTNGELFCLVNNAGISVSGALEFIPIQDFRQEIEVNLIGQLALTQRSLPMIRKGRGRLIFVSSVAGRLVTPFNGPYATSKAALVAMADGLRLELMPWEIYVSVLFVGSVQTPIWEKSAHLAGEILRRAPSDAWNMYGAMQKRTGAFYRQTAKNGMSAESVARIIRGLVEVEHPKEYILVGRSALRIELAVKLLPVRLRDWLVRYQMDLLKS
jgi:NAD(P)-dependent dehydrogenase (short-subunit alcohol dehydrogenase family)